MSQPVELVEVQLLRLPLEVWQRTQEHVDGLLREFALIAQDDEAKLATPGRLLALVQELSAGFGGFSESQRIEMEEALVRGEAEIDLTYRMPRAAAGAAQQLGDMLDEADEYCRRGDHLLTLATPGEELRFRHWFISEFVDQLRGAPPTPWSDCP
ncbi:MAG TPA: hypothetical protein VMZ73_00790 [Acidimicrobiales bacterium]|nr:hypothetical protein [Acidimicrobiales bacterium]